MQPPAAIVQLAVEIARESPCQKSKRGAVMWNERLSRAGHNALPVGRCDGSEACRASCGRRCVHAEQEVILKWLATTWSMNGGATLLKRPQLLHVKVDDAGSAAPSGPPSCLECAKLILRTDVRWVWLLHEDGWRAYAPRQFYQETLRTLGLEEVS